MKEIHLISLGAGVQSSTMALMAGKQIHPMPIAAIFADTQAEPKSVYTWLEELEKMLPFPVIRVTQGEGLEQDALKIRSRKDGKGNWVRSGIPHYSINKDGSGGHGPRQCTQDFKLAPILRETRRLLKEHDASRAVQWIGISLDEAHRMKPSRVKYAVCRWPLIELEMKRCHCENWLANRGLKAPRSACVFCPYHSNFEWKRLKEEEPREFERAVRFEKAYQEAKRTTLNHTTFSRFLHPERIPLDEVDFSTDLDRGQLSLFGNECEGMCGV